MIVLFKQGLTRFFVIFDDPGKGNEGLLLVDVFDFAAQARGCLCLVLERDREVGVGLGSLAVACGGPSFQLVPKVLNSADVLSSGGGVAGGGSFVEDVEGTGDTFLLEGMSWPRQGLLVGRTASSLPC